MAGSPSATIAIQRASRAAHIPADATLRRWTLAALARKATLTLRYVGETEARRLNREFRGKDYATNVLTFVYDDTPGLEGDIVICAAVVAREAKAQGKAVQAHHAHLLVHGVLHLQGLDHERERDAKRMEAREAAILARLGFANPYEAGL
ncbi:rRNA maturation RNase YbeY [Betaproteobacteria bacterium GR16-43]|nr:rRNA maturation RNase YbeY [Betaproteobacteria bacterium GR16-43]